MESPVEASMQDDLFKPIHRTSIQLEGFRYVLDFNQCLFFSRDFSKDAYTILCILVQVELERSAKTPLDQAVSKYIIAGYLVNSVKTIPPGHKDPPAKRHSRPPPRGDCRIVEQIYGYPRPWHPSYTGNLNGAGLSIIWIC